MKNISKLTRKRLRWNLVFNEVVSSLKKFLIEEEFIEDGRSNNVRVYLGKYGNAYVI